MPLGRHTRTASGRYRRERGDAKVSNLRKTYPELRGVNGNTQLGTLRKRLGVDSLSGVLKKLRQR